MRKAKQGPQPRANIDHPGIMSSAINNLPSNIVSNRGIGKSKRAAKGHKEHRD